MNYRSDECPDGGFYISAASLLLEFRHFIDSHPSLVKIDQANPLWPKLVLYCEQLEQYPKLMRSVTLLHVTSQIDFERALFCSWGSLAVAKFLNIPEPHQRALFFAGLFQDVGKHATEPDLKRFIGQLGPPSALSPHIANGDYTHPLASSTYIEEVLPDVEGLTDLVLYHHAKDDGTGYPHHISESQLGIDNQILIIANEISDRLDRLGGHNQLVASLPSLKIGALLYFKRAHTGWINVIEPHLEAEAELTDSGRVRRVLMSKRDRLEKLISHLLAVSGELLRFDFDLQVHGLRSMIRKLAGLMADTGVLNHQLFANPELVSKQELSDIAMIFKGIPEALERCLAFIEHIITRKFDACTHLLGEARRLLRLNIRELEDRPCSIFR